jgi:hypothetical protein
MISSRLDHLVLVSPTLEDGVRWCEHHLGVQPGPGGAHPLMGTHNRLLNISSAGFPNAYLEIIALDPAATPTRASGLRRWFDMDDEHLMARVHTLGPLLAHWVARTPNVHIAATSLQSEGLEPGDILQASRMTATGLLQWKITVRDDGRRLLDGALPTLIEWGNAHPTDHMPSSGVALERLILRHPQAQALKSSLQVLGLQDSPLIRVESGEPGLEAEFQVRGLTRTVAPT